MIFFICVSPSSCLLTLAPGRSARKPAARKRTSSAMTASMFFCFIGRTETISR